MLDDFEYSNKESHEMPKIAKNISNKKKIIAAILCALSVAGFVLKLALIPGLLITFATLLFVDDACFDQKHPGILCIVHLLAATFVICAAILLDSNVLTFISGILITLSCKWFRSWFWAFETVEGAAAEESVKDDEL